MSRVVRLGVFIFGTLTILAAGIFLIGNKRFLFDSTYRIKAGFKTLPASITARKFASGGFTREP